MTGEKLFFEPTLAGRPRSPQRLKVKAGYEVILVALNDYPLTLVVDGRAFWRDDVPSLPGWEFSLNAGLRFSLWAPARRTSQQPGLPAASAAQRPFPAEPPEPVQAPAPEAAPAPSPEPSPEPQPEQGQAPSDTERLIRAVRELQRREGP